MVRDRWIAMFGAENVYNKHCKHLALKDSEYSCKVKMDMSFCGNKCAYATNVKGANEVNARGKVVGIKK